MITTLAWNNLWSRKARTVLTALAIAFSVSLVVAMTSGIAAFQTAAMSFVDRFMGSVDATIVRTSDPAKGIDASLMAELSADRDVRLAIPRLDSDAPQAGASMSPLEIRMKLVGVDRGKDPLLDWMKLNTGRWFAPGERAVVIDQGYADRTGATVGQQLRLNGAHGELSLPIVGIVHSPAIMRGWSQTIYAPLTDVQAFKFGTDRPDRLSQIRIQFNAGIDSQKFSERWTQRLQGIDPQLRFKLTRQTRDEIERNFLGLRLMSLLGGAVTMLAAMFIIVSTLSMGVSERQRTLAMLRAVGASRGQVARLVIVEGIGLAGIGVALGVVIGFALAAGVIYFLSDMFPLTPTLDLLGTAAAAVGAMGASLFASLLPAWQAIRVDPLEAMAPLARATRRGIPWVATIAGLILVSIDPLILHLPFEATFEREVRFYGHFIVGLPCVMIGFFMLAPLFIYLTNAVVGPIAAMLMRVPRQLVSQQISSNGLWRSAGTCAALMVGLATLLVMQTQGKSSLGSWTIPDKFPDVFIVSRNGISAQQQEIIRSVDLLKRDDVMPIGTFAPEVGGGIFGLIGTRLPGNTLFVAVEPERAFRLLQLDFRQGNAADAARLLAQGSHVVITEEFQQLRGLKVGDKLPLRNSQKQTIEFTVAGVVWSPGIDVMLSSFDLQGQFEKQSAATVFGSTADAKKFFDADSVYVMCANMARHGIDKAELRERLQSVLGDPNIHVADVRLLKAQISNGMNRLLQVASLLAWGALAVASLGVANTIMAGIRSRMWEFGVLRSIGLTRGVLLRVVLVEAILLGCVGAAMGIACGAVLTFGSRAILALTIGHRPPFVVPWDVVGLGACAVIGVSVIASILPAVSVARREPLGLLQAGRGSG